MRRARPGFAAACILLAAVLTTMLYTTQGMSTPFVQVAFADTLTSNEIFHETDNTQKLEELVQSQLKEVEHETNVEALVNTALEKVGCPYVSGGRGPRAFDCSGFVQFCANQALGVELPRTSYAQAQCGVDVPMDALERGDLLFWGSRSSSNHVGIYLGDGTYVHAAGSGKGVRVSTFDYYAPTFAKRIIG